VQVRVLLPSQSIIIMNKRNLPKLRAQAIGIHVVLLPAKKEEKKTDGGIITQTAEGFEAAATFQQATVVSVGQEVKKFINVEGEDRNIAPGDECYIIKGSGVPFEEDGVNYLIIREDSFVCYLPENE
jgi:co-chaperonin GroES (HSP10)